VTLTLPAFYMPYQWRLNPNLDAVRRHSRSWCRGHGLLDAGIWDDDAFDAAEFALLTCLVHPDAALRRVEFIADWFVMLFYFDDFFLENYKRTMDLAGGKAYVRRLEAFVPLHPAVVPAPADEVESLLVELWPRTLLDMSPTMLRRFRQHVVEYLRATVWELSNRVYDWVPDPIEYVQMRRKTFAPDFASDLVEYGLGIEIPVRVFGSSTIGALTRAFADWASLENDIVSYPKESELEDEVNNGVVIATGFLDVGPQQGIELVNDLLTARLLQFEHIVATELDPLLDDAQLGEHERSAVLAYVYGIRDWLAGDHKWHLLSGRNRWDVAAERDATQAGSRFAPSGLGTSAVRLDGAFASR
jgi:germacradienol/geosmin synthase